MSFDPSLLGSVGSQGRTPIDDTSLSVRPQVGDTGFYEDEETYVDFEETAQEDPLRRLMRDPKKHAALLRYLVSRIDYSEDEMSKFYSRWQSNELRLQAHINLSSKEQALQDENDANMEPNAVPIVVPFGYAAISTLTTYMVNTFASRRPMFTVGAHRGEDWDRARNMEVVLQQQADHNFLLKEFWKNFNDIGTYGAGIMRPEWVVIEKMRTRRQGGGPFNLGAVSTVRAPQVVYEGNEVNTIDPFFFFPDPRVAMADVADKGEFVWWRDFISRLELRRSDDYDYVDRIPRGLPPTRRGGISVRNWKARGASIDEQVMGRGEAQIHLEHDFVQIDQGTCWIIPDEFGLSSSTEIELWYFTIGNKKQIIEAMRFDMDHEKHPVAVAEPYGLGHGFGHAGPADYVGPIQDMMSWLLNSHIANTRTAINNMWIVDPHRVVMQDLKKPGAGKVIRLKKTALGQDVRTALFQLPVNDVTRGHIADADLMMQLGQMLLAINENIMGQPQQGGRKTASEVRISGQAALSRLSTTTRVTSAQQISPLTEMMALNTQQFISEEYYYIVTGMDGAKASIRAEDLDGELKYPIHDGSLPLDKFALLEVWKELLLGTAQSEQLSMQYDVAKIFEHVAELAGATNIEDFRRDPQGQSGVNMQLMPNDQFDREKQAGNVVPISSVPQTRLR